MNRGHFDVPSSLIAHPAMIALAVSVLSVLAMLIVDHGPWSRPHIQTAELATHKTTGEGAHRWCRGEADRTQSSARARSSGAEAGAAGQSHHALISFARLIRRTSVIA